MAAWAGLGYYSRARNLVECARTVAALPGARFPESAAALAKLPGIGAYTSAAIAAIAFDEPVAVDRRQRGARRCAAFRHRDAAPRREAADPRTARSRSFRQRAPENSPRR